jgi:hypothetical protein
MAGLPRAVVCVCLLSAAALAFARPVGAAPSCLKTEGPAKAKLYVRQCLQVSPATHPPCNAANACALIQDEIRRGCGLLGKDAPPFCRAYKRSGKAEPWPPPD